MKSGALRNTIEMGDLLDDLADIEKMIAKNEKEPEPKAQEPVAPTQQSPNEPKDNQEIS